MKEIEILTEITSSDDDVRRALAQFSFKGSSKVFDRYLRNDAFTELEPDASGRLRGCIRLRRSGSATILTHKKDHFNDDGTWSFSDEAEIVVASFADAERFLHALGFTTLVDVSIQKEKYVSPPYEIVYEIVEHLGRFLEVELCTDAPVSVPEEKEKIRTFIRTLGLSLGDELDQGKPELMLRKLKSLSRET